MMKTGSWEKLGVSATWMGVLIAAAALVLAAPAPVRAVGVAQMEIFELDGNALDDNGGDDWENIHNGSHNALVITNGGDVNDPDDSGIIDDTYDPASNDDVFTGGSTKDEIDIPNWLWKYARATPDKDNITNAYAAAYLYDNDLIIYFGADRFANNGDAMIGFWFFKNTVEEDGTTHTFTGQHAYGDILVLTNFTKGGVVDTVLVYMWNTAVTGNLELLGSYGECSPTNTDPVCAINNDGGDVAPWDYLSKSGDTTFPMNSFFEGGINVSQLLNGAGDCYTAFLAETRTSQSTDAVLKDFVLSAFPICSIDASKDCELLRLATNDDPGNGGLDFAYYGRAYITVTNDGVATLPAGTEITIDDLPAGDSTNPDAFLVTLADDLIPDGTVTYQVDFLTNDNPPSNSAEVSTVFGALILTADTGWVVCESLELTPNLAIEKDCLTKLALNSGVVAAKVDYGVKVCNTGDMPLEVTVTDPTTGLSEVVDLDTGQTCAIDSDCNPSGLCVNLHCMNLPGYVSDGPVCATFTGDYFPSALPLVGGVSTDVPCAAIFTNTVNATGVGLTPDAPQVGPVEASANCPLCDNCE